ncbi:MAG: tRNA (adenosine(37)-N6)-dimethylallyltransferase MiaA [Chromatiales bacterium]|jgi:tRNA dimethylallyltransferase
MSEQRIGIQPPAIFLMGPTASGKTELALQLVESLPLEIVSVDSALVYRGMDIGTAKPGSEILARAPHRLIDIREPTQAYSAAEFRQDALQAMQEITLAGRVPLLVGGTMLYYRALEQGLSELPKADPGLRARLEGELQRSGLQRLHKRLALLDPEAARRIHENDPQRTLRALEVIELTGRPLSELQSAGRGDRLPYRLLKLVRAPKDRKELHRRIEARFMRMLDAGFADEVRGLQQLPGFTPQLPAMRAVGYRQMIRHLLGELSWEEMIEQGVIATRQLAKRQFTWLRSEPACIWLEESPDLLNQLTSLITGFLANPEE